MHTSSIPVARKPFWRRQQFWRVALPVATGLAVLIAGLVVYQQVYGSNGVSNAKNGWGVSYPPPAKPKTVKLDPQIRGIVRRFIDTAVARRNLDVAYAISGPAIRQGMTRAQFGTGRIPVVPYPVTAKTKITMKLDYSFATKARLQAFVVTPDRKVKSPHTFFVDLVKHGNTWLVNSWVPRWTPPIPTPG